MSLFAVFAVLLTITALLSYVNERFLRLPATIGVMAAALCGSLLLALAGRLGFGGERWAVLLLQEIDFGEVLMNGMLRAFGMSDETRHYQDVFWELIDEVLNAVLFVLIGLSTIPLVLVVRFMCVGIPITVLRTIREFGPATVRLMTWGGIRGGISIALALSLPASPHRDLILVATYTVVVFSVLVQGLTVGRAVRWALR